MLVRYKEIDDPFAGMANRTLKGMLVEAIALKGINKLLSAHMYLYRNMPQLYDENGRKIADNADVQALNLLMVVAATLVADTAMDAVCQS